MMVELCNKICPFRPQFSECSKCPEIYAQTASPEPGQFEKKSLATQPEGVVIDPENHAIHFTPEIVVVGYERKQCCYMDKCTTVALDAVCDPICYEPCDSVCTGRCFVNPECPHQCDVIRKEQLKLRYRIWLAQKLNEIKKKYRAMATACLLRTRLAFVGEVQNYYQAAKQTIGEIQLLRDEDEASEQLQHQIQEQPQQMQQLQSQHQIRSQVADDELDDEFEV